jgi:hypothetical protein
LRYQTSSQKNQPGKTTTKAGVGRIGNEGESGLLALGKRSATILRPNAAMNAACRKLERR